MAEKTGWNPGYIKQRPYYEILQMVNVYLVRDGGEYKWRAGDTRRKLDEVLK